MQNMQNMQNIQNMQNEGEFVLVNQQIEMEVTDGNVFNSEVHL